MILFLFAYLTICNDSFLQIKSLQLQLNSKSVKWVNVLILFEVFFEGILTVY